MTSKDKAVEYIKQEIEKELELQRLLSLRWDQRLWKCGVMIIEGEYYIPDAWETPDSYVYLKALVDPFIGISMVRVLDSDDCFYTSHMPMSVSIDWEFVNYKESCLVKFKEILQRLEVTSDFEQISANVEDATSSMSLHCSFTG